MRNHESLGPQLNLSPLCHCYWEITLQSNELSATNVLIPVIHGYGPKWRQLPSTKCYFMKSKITQLLSKDSDSKI